ncbi:hypothetical protein LEMLEM_LOCUS23689 [Lemmus lemmus]
MQDQPSQPNPHTAGLQRDHLFSSSCPAAHPSRSRALPICLSFSAKPGRLGCRRVPGLVTGSRQFRSGWALGRTKRLPGHSQPRLQGTHLTQMGVWFWISLPRSGSFNLASVEHVKGFGN